MEIIPVVVGLLFIAFGVYLTYDTYNFRKIAVHSRGKLIGYESHISRSNNGHRSTMYTPVIEFPCKGETYCFKATISRGNMPHAVGSSLPILYLKSDPHNARLFTNLRYWMAGIFTFIGLIAFFVGAANFSFDGFSLLITMAILITLIVKGLKLKKKLNQKGIHTFDDIKDSIQQAKLDHDISSTESVKKNYQPSSEMIGLQGESTANNKAPAWLGKVFLLIGLGLFIGGAFWGKQRADFIASATKTTGKVIEMRPSTSDGSTTYAPVVSYQFNVQQTPAVFTHGVSSSPPSWHTGDKVNVLYNPKDENDAMIDDGLWNWAGPGILALVGFILFSSGFSASLKKKKTGRNKYIQ